MKKNLRLSYTVNRLTQNVSLMMLHEVIEVQYTVLLLGTSSGKLSAIKGSIGCY